jgi:menaquinone-specific isochorismate synthase
VTTAAAVKPLIVETVELTGPDAAAVADLTEVLPAAAPFAWIRHGDGIVGWGETARLQLTGPDRFARAVRWWRSLHSTAEVHDSVGLPGCGPVVFGSFAFADGPTASTLVLPRVLVGRRAGRTWLTTVGDGHDGPGLLRRQVALQPSRVEISEGTRSAQAWREAVAAAIERIQHGELSKVVLARDLFARAEGPVDVRHVVGALARTYPQCFTFTVDGLVGATPELLIRRFGTAVSSRVLAGTAWRSADGHSEPDAEVAARLWASTKEQEEHAYAASSAADALRPHCSDLTVPSAPTVLALPNVVHLATEVSGTLRSGAGSLALAGLLHPTAAVCGTPTAAAARVIADLEGMDRGRYAGPVGWMDAAGDGEWGIALRCAQVEGDRLRLFAGCGIVAGSDPDVELAETQAKFLAVRDTLDAVDVDQACLS